MDRGKGNLGRLKCWNLEEISREECEDEGRCEIYFSRRIVCGECGC